VTTGKRARAASGARIGADRRAELAGGPPTGMRPLDDNGLHSMQSWEIAVASPAGA
jgi:hypothetical protein